MENNICAVISTFSPSKEFLHRLDCIVEQVSKVVIINDSGDKHRVDFVLEAYGSIVHVINNKENIGIAASLNKGIKFALLNKFSHIIFLDDDTVVDRYFVANALDYIEKGNSEEIVVGGVIVNNFESSISYSSPLEVRNLITSGTVLSASIFNKVMQFDEEYFIDNVDFDFCLRLRKKGIKLFILKNCMMKHSIGSLKIRKILGIQVFVFNHSPFRLYYQSRNIFLYWHRHFSSDFVFCIYQGFALLKIPLKIVIFEDEKKLRLKYFFKGVMHGIFNKGGRLT